MITRTSDTVILVMGQGGSGKSSFISHLVTAKVPIGHGLRISVLRFFFLGAVLTHHSATKQLGIYHFDYNESRKVYLIDVPSLVDGPLSRKLEVLRDFAVFLCYIYTQKIPLAGIIYLQDIISMRMLASDYKHLDMLKKFCGEEAYKRVTLVTTMWSKLDGSCPSGSFSHEHGIRRERELIRRDDLWGSMSKSGSKIRRHAGDRKSAMGIVTGMVKRGLTASLGIQREMVDQGKSLEATAMWQEFEKLGDVDRKYKEVWGRSAMSPH